MAVVLVTPPARAGADKAIYVVTYIEVRSNAVDTAVTLLADYRYASRDQVGCSRFDVLHEIARPERFAIFEIWSDKAALDAHNQTASTTGFHQKLAEIQEAPSDERVNAGLYLAPIANNPSVDPIYVLTHVDLIPESHGQGLALLDTMRAASSRESGNLAYEVLQQANRLNHFTIVEAWRSMGALEGHTGAQHTRAFREAVLPMEGALYDDRRYRKLP